MSVAEDLIYVVERGTGELSVIDEVGQVTVKASLLQDPLDVEILPNGNLLVAERASYSDSTGYLTEISPDGTIISTGYPGFSPTDIFVDDDGTIYVTSINSGIWKKGPSDSSYTMFSMVTGDVCDMIRFGDHFYAVDAYGVHGLWRIDPVTGTPTAILSGAFNTALGLAVFGDDLLVTDWGANKIWLVTGLPFSPILSAFKEHVYQASSFTSDREDNILLSHQRTPGAISKIDKFGTLTTFVGDTSELSNPRGLVFLTNVTIDIKPGSDPNSINLGSRGNVPVAIFGTADFDATTVDPTTITLAGASVKLKGKGTPMASFEDVNEDGILDIVVHVDTSALELSEEDIVAILVGKTFNGVIIRGEDTVRIVQE